MNEFQKWLARIALEAVGGRGFVLGGGHAIQLHGMAARPSDDIDLFKLDRGGPAEVESDVVAAFRKHQLTVNVTRRTPDLVQMMVQHARRRNLQSRPRNLLARSGTSRP